MASSAATLSARCAAATLLCDTESNGVVPTANEIALEGFDVAKRSAGCVVRQDGFACGTGFVVMRGMTLGRRLALPHYAPC
jgi:hypothetical protein